MAIKFSVIIPLYNKANEIKKTIESCLNQSYPISEIIVIDDGSVDKGHSVVEGITDSRIKLIRTLNNGVSSARNLGIKHAKNDFIAFLDADDLWNKHFIAIIQKLIIGFPNCSVFATAYGTMENNIIYPVGLKNVPEFDILESFFKSASNGESPIHSSAVVIKKECFNKVGGFKEDYRIGEDLDMWCRLAIVYKIAFCNKILSYYRQDSENRISVKNVINFELPFWELLKKTSRKGGREAKNCKKYLARSIQAVAADNIKNGGFQFVKELIFKKECYYPTTACFRIIKSSLIEVKKTCIDTLLKKWIR